MSPQMALSNRKKVAPVAFVQFISGVDFQMCPQFACRTKMKSHIEQLFIKNKHSNVFSKHLSEERLSHTGQNLLFITGNSVMLKTLNPEILKNSPSRVRLKKKGRVG